MSLTSTNSTQKKYLKIILEGNRQAASDLIGQLISEKMPPDRVYSTILAPAQRQLGRLWVEGKISIAQEHLASQITLEMMDRIRSSTPAADPLPFKVLVTAVEGDQHFIGARMAADLFLAQGWQVDFLGPDTPTEDLVSLVSQRKPDLVVLSASTEDLLVQAIDTIEKLKKMKTPPKIILGGAVIYQKENLDYVGADVIARDFDSALRQARNLVEQDRESDRLGSRLKQLGQSIQQHRRLRGWNQQKLAERAGLDRTYISLLERGGQNISLSVLFRIAEALHVPAEVLLQGEE